MVGNISCLPREIVMPWTFCLVFGKLGNCKTWKIVGVSEDGHQLWDCNWKEGTFNECFESRD